MEKYRVSRNGTGMPIFRVADQLDIDLVVGLKDYVPLD